MSRSLRVEYPDAWYHVMNRGAAYQDIFLTDDHRLIFLDLLGEVGDLFGLEFHAYCLMDNHYHLLIHTPRGNLSRGMRHLNGVYTQRFNRLEKRDGPLFRGRYKAIIVDVDHYVLQVSRYIHCNPIAARRVGRLKDYPWSSYRAYIGGERSPAWLHRNDILGMVADDDAEEHYRAFVEQGIDEETAVFYGKKNQSSIFGNDLFRKRIKSALSAEKDYSEIPEHRQLSTVPSIEHIKNVCAAQFGIDAADLNKDGRGSHGKPRTFAIALCRVVGGYPLKEIGRAFGGISYMGVSSAIARVRQRLENDPQFARLVSETQEKLKGE